ncbi:malonic semialdehyde reductase [Sphingomonas solaris]|uniref:Malonic semialdehyde reductase n=1 Tax=Alterirhizorhabdus solaris TaxID=2529389 RepID=A0A558R4G0_9SPHN|nr:malonic semialdehyde reductase [Sphingomonas solaris]TVV74238.1 malonic semialdehyde reductase [Sphingomonas solaris]
MAILSDEGLDLIFRKARSYNGYQDRPVSPHQLRAIWDLMKWGPTSANMLPARIVWCVSDESRAKLAALSSGTNGPKILQAPVTAIIASDFEFYDQLPKTFPHTDARSWFMLPDGTPNAPSVEDAAFRNSTLQGAYFIIAARALGLDTGPMSGIDKAAIDAEFFAGTAYRTNFVSTLGYGDPATIFERLPRLDFDEVNRIV